LQESESSLNQEPGDGKPDSPKTDPRLLLQLPPETVKILLFKNHPTKFGEALTTYAFASTFST